MLKRRHSCHCWKKCIFIFRLIHNTIHRCSTTDCCSRAFADWIQIVTQNVHNLSILMQFFFQTIIHLVRFCYHVTYMCLETVDVSPCRLWSVFHHNRVKATIAFLQESRRRTWALRHPCTMETRSAFQSRNESIVRSHRHHVCFGVCSRQYYLTKDVCLDEIAVGSQRQAQILALPFPIVLASERRSWGESVTDSQW
jgi:hypothetical protein